MARTRYANPDLALKLPAWRSALVFGLLGLGFLALVGRSLYLQVRQEEFLQKEGEARYSRVIALVAKRGVITDRNGLTLARSAQAASIWANPSETDEITAVQYAVLAKTLGMNEKDIKAKFAGKERGFVYLKRRINPDIATALLQQKIPGIYQQPEYKRIYPAHEVMAHIVGFTDPDEHGQEGIERSKDSLLAGKAGSWGVIKDRRGYVVEDLGNKVPPKDGETVALSIDSDIQYLAYRELAAGVAEAKAKAGGVVVLDAHTGEVLALANIPTYNPNNRSTIIQENMRNRVLTDQFEPGSMMKPISISAALDNGVITPNSTFVTTGSMQIANRTITDTHNYGMLTTGGVIQKSSNIGTATIALKMPPEMLWTMYDKVGFGKIPATGFPGEAKGRLRPFKTWKPVEQATMSYGYGISVSLMQVARSYMIFANQGAIRPVSILKQSAPGPATQVIKPETAAEMLKMLEKVTLPGGTAQLAQVVGYRVGGKTGTAYKHAAGGYSKNKYVASFVGVAPISAPRVIVAVMIDEPDPSKHYGGQVSAPIFSKITAGIMRKLGVQPDAPAQTVIIPGFDEPEAETGL
ncbi:penicillin-binding protein 2 [Leeia sp. TBRC 13508]|uniref:Peptidoglycan D,D-transpeptidase FtsI n=1 Tax=Leeia speluncae TaxID=2884804 RepID=A0ABS8D692_9NEIS|nr:penicillin-binding protein 2 [Leeia speluncae]MCB6183491.1 penicillin-binding protein 2 [Leeia speluncae]